MIAEERLEKPDFAAYRALVERTRALFEEAGIYFQISTKARAEEEVPTVSDEWLEKFVIEPDNQAFFLRISSPPDVQEFNDKFIGQLDRIRETFNKYNENNTGVLSKEMQDKIVSFGIQFARMNRTFVGKRKAIERAVNEANSIEELRSSIRNTFASILKNIFRNVVEPLYDGMRVAPDAAYEFILREVNEFLSWLGISTLTVELGAKISDALPYDLKPAETPTNEPDKKDSIAEIEHYAYVFNEGRGAENFCVYEGSVLVNVYHN